MFTALISGVTAVAVIVVAVKTRDTINIASNSVCTYCLFTDREA